MAIRRDGYTCQVCGIKQSKVKGREVKVEIHHLDGGVENWPELIEAVRKYLLCDPDKMRTLCEDCHRKLTGEVRNVETDNH